MVVGDRTRVVGETVGGETCEARREMLSDCATCESGREREGEKEKERRGERKGRRETRDAEGQGVREGRLGVVVLSRGGEAAGLVDLFEDLSELPKIERLGQVGKEALLVDELASRLR